MRTYEQGMQGTGEAHHPSRCKSMPAEGHSSGNHGLRHGPRPYRDVKSDIRQVPDSPALKFDSAASAAASKQPSEHWFSSVEVQHVTC